MYSYHPGWEFHGVMIHMTVSNLTVKRANRIAQMSISNLGLRGHEYGKHKISDYILNLLGPIQPTPP